MSGEDISWIANLFAAAKEMPDHFEGQIQEELIGMDLTQPLPFELTEEPKPEQAAEAAAASGLMAPEDADLLARATLSEKDVTVDSTAPFEVHPALADSLNLEDGDSVEFGESSEPARSITAIRNDLVGGGGAAAQTTSAEGEDAGAATATGGEGQRRQGRKPRRSRHSRWTSGSTP